MKRIIKITDTTPRAIAYFEITFSMALRCFGLVV